MTIEITHTLVGRHTLKLDNAQSTEIEFDGRELFLTTNIQQLSYGYARIISFEGKAEILRIKKFFVEMLNYDLETISYDEKVNFRDENSGGDILQRSLFATFQEGKLNFISSWLGGSIFYINDLTIDHLRQIVSFIESIEPVFNQHYGVVKCGQKNSKNVEQSWLSRKLHWLKS